MEDFILGALLMLLGVLVVIYSKPLAKDARKFHMHQNEISRRLNSSLKLTQVINIIWGLGVALVGLALMLRPFIP
jgi:hypothetical protein